MKRIKYSLVCYSLFFFIFVTGDSMFRVIVDLFVAGTETTQTALSWAFIYLVEFPDVQEKCQKEINTVLNKI
jgi:cytochrome P450 family 2 subfamily J